MVCPLSFTSLESLCSVPNMQLPLTSAYIIPSSSWCYFPIDVYFAYNVSSIVLLLFETCQPESRCTFAPQIMSLLLPVVIHKHLSSRGILFSLSYQPHKKQQALTDCNSPGKIRKCLSTSRPQFSTQIFVYCSVLGTYIHQLTSILSPWPKKLPAGRRVFWRAAHLTHSWWQAIDNKNGI